jgi:hypothetical protein
MKGMSTEGIADVLEGFRCKNNFTAFLGYNYCFLYHY